MIPSSFTSSSQTGAVRCYNWPLGSSIKYISVSPKHCVKGRITQRRKQLSGFGLNSEKSSNSLWRCVYREELRQERDGPQTPQEEPATWFKQQTNNYRLFVDQGWQREKKGFHVNLTAGSLVNPLKARMRPPRDQGSICCGDEKKNGFQICSYVYKSKAAGVVAASQRCPPLEARSLKAAAASRTWRPDLFGFGNSWRANKWVPTTCFHLQ